MKCYLIGMLLLSLPVFVRAKDDTYTTTDNGRQSYERTAGASELKIRLSDNTPITVMLNRIRFINADRLIRFANIPPGRYRVSVFVDAAGGMKRRNLVYDGNLRLEPSTSYYLIVDRTTGSAKINTTAIDGAYVAAKDANDPDDMYIGNYGEQQVIITDRQEREPEGTAASETLTAADMDDINAQFNGKRSGADKLAQLQNALGSKTYTSAQVKKMMAWLNNDDDKLRFVKWAYDQTVDKSNYWRLEIGLVEAAARKDFNQFLNRRSQSEP